MLPRVMNQKLLLTFTVLSVAGMTLEAEEQARIIWKNISPGGGGRLPCVAVSPHDSKLVNAGCDVGGFFKSTDGGGTWRICNTGLRGYYVECILPHPRDPKTIFIGTEDGMHKSTDGGESRKSSACWCGRCFLCGQVVSEFLAAQPP